MADQTAETTEPQRISGKEGLVNTDIIKQRAKDIFGQNGIDPETSGTYDVSSEYEGRHRIADVIASINTPFPIAATGNIKTDDGSELGANEVLSWIQIVGFDQASGRPIELLQETFPDNRKTVKLNIGEVRSLMDLIEYFSDQDRELAAKVLGF